MRCESNVDKNNFLIRISFYSQFDTVYLVFIQRVIVMNKNLMELIQSRRSVYQFKTEVVDIELINQCLEAAIWAPNHKLTQPWRFWVLGKNYQAKLAQIYAFNRASKKFDIGSDSFDNAFEQAKLKFEKIPQVVLIGQVKSDNLITEKEDYAACSCAIQNFKLMAWEHQIGVQWSTGPILKDNDTFELLDIHPNQIALIAALYCGFPQCLPKSTRKLRSEVTTYLD